MTPEDKARAFCERERAFRLGTLLTETSHPATRTLSQAAQEDVSAAIRMLQTVDRDLPPVLKATLQGGGYTKLVTALRRALRDGRRVFVTGCGATGRLAILLEACWRRAVAELSAEHPDAAAWSDTVTSVMAGGDFALIKSVEGFEDFPDFGRRQIAEGELAQDDVVIAVTEGGETSFVIGTAWEGVDRGAEVFFVYNNPTDLLREHVQRSREVIEDDRVTKIDLHTGPMAVAGSTRMQATTIELAVVGAAMEDALLGAADRDVPSADERVAAFNALLDVVEAPDAVTVMADLTRREAELYERGGRVLYFADTLLLDILTDTTERSPTFSLPAFRRRDDHVSARSWSFVKDPGRDTAAAWEAMLGRPIRGVDWDRDVYAAMGAPGDVVANPPALDAATIEKFPIGCEPEDQPSQLVVTLHSADDPEDFARPDAFCLRIGASRGTGALGGHIAVPAAASLAGPMRLGDHLAAKLALNTLSTATMAVMGRLAGNWMVHVRTSNKKLIDRGVRLLVDQTGMGYETACIELFRAMDHAERLPPDAERPSPVAWVIQQHGTANAAE
ncbi:MAG: sugar phosphate isomerase [Planctomycetota bacterium]